ncbi:MFS transporter [Rhizosaccharibacter radicis]|uniref:MFS transporter n=1 Tax=Rhizosaccharibacter radicis TaxID=2782605 RepID=A0ABT1VVR8_9PROT|nr:MFS transporter [Acetobacteraceae bacterium KSS12]
MVSRRIVPFVTLLYFVSFLDRVNVGFAAVTMNRALGLSGELFGLGAGIFFLGYAGFEVPSNLILDRVGPRLWIARVMITWGVVSGLTAFVEGPRSFILARFMLGLAEAGFFPGIVLYLSRWFPRARLGTVGAVFMVAAPLASTVGSPVSAALMQLHGVFGLQGWQWLFLMEALPSLLLGVACLWFLTDEPSQAAWLPAAERDWLVGVLARERAERADGGNHVGVAAALRDRRVLLLGAIYLGTSVGLYVVGIWTPLLLSGAGVGLWNIGWLGALINVVAVIGMVWWARRSDRRRERFFHVALACLVAAAGLLLAGLAMRTQAAGAGPQPFLVPLLVLSLALANLGVNAAKPPLWTLPPSFLDGAGAAAGIALINSLGTLGGAVGPLLIGLFRHGAETGSGGFLTASGILLASALLVWPLRRWLKGPAPS